VALAIVTVGDTEAQVLEQLVLVSDLGTDVAEVKGKLGRKTVHRVGDLLDLVEMALQRRIEECSEVVSNPGLAEEIGQVRSECGGDSLGGCRCIRSSRHCREKRKLEGQGHAMWYKRMTAQKKSKMPGAGL